MAALYRLLLSCVWVPAFALDDLLPPEVLAKDAICSDGAEEDCSLSLLQVQGTQSKYEQQDEQAVAASWQGARETKTSCMFSDCPGILGPTECYHLRCVCLHDFVFSEVAGGMCVSRDSQAGRATISPKDTGDTCYLAECKKRFTSCIDNKCLCRAGYMYAQGECRRIMADPYPEPPPPQPELPSPQPQPQPPPEPQPQPQPQQSSPPPSGPGACALFPGCAGLEGNCCPNDNGLRLHCCDQSQ
eukprot:TRINITY_DN47040_c0_g1_i1.p1 TRINITY_DN47040_c0_g1~~TRINITY_DN47040_c0_g1_i1.p1  ORF type:complete len:244 (+),score=39.40 TRINITY_DN47040_c0_g1_i1:54-785(+)